MLQHNTAPFGCLRVAREYFDSATLVQRPAESYAQALRQKLSFPAYFLVGHAIELALKAFLLGRGMTIDILRSRKYGHNLDALLSEARRRKLGTFVKLSNAELQAIVVLNQCYSAKEFEYSATGVRRLPHYADIYAIADRLTRGLRKFCLKLATPRATKVTRKRG